MAIRTAQEGSTLPRAGITSCPTRRRTPPCSTRGWRPPCSARAPPVSATVLVCVFASRDVPNQHPAVPSATESGRRRGAQRRPQRRHRGAQRRRRDHRRRMRARLAAKSNGPHRRHARRMPSRCRQRRVPATHAECSCVATSTHRIGFGARRPCTWARCVRDRTMQCRRVPADETNRGTRHAPGQRREPRGTPCARALRRGWSGSQLLPCAVDCRGAATMHEQRREATAPMHPADATRADPCGLVHSRTRSWILGAGYASSTSSSQHRDHAG